MRSQKKARQVEKGSNNYFESHTHTKKQCYSQNVFHFCITIKQVFQKRPAKTDDLRLKYTEREARSRRRKFEDYS
jgi:hypothetical protein